MYSDTSPDSVRNPATAQQAAIRIFERLMRGSDGSAALRLWNDALHAPGDESPDFTLVVRDPAVLRDAWRLPARTDADLKPADALASRIARRFSHRHSRDSDRAAIAFHYDVSNEFYRLWLAADRVYSCAYFNREAALREVDEPTYRVWRLYMSACALEFEAGGTGIYQILASRRNRGEWPVQLSRRDLYAGRDDGQFAGVN